MRYVDVVLEVAKQRAWEDLSDEAGLKYLKEAVKALATKQPLSILRRWAVQTGPSGEGV